MNGKRVVVTGVGVISSLGSSPEELYRRLRAGESGVRSMEEWSGTEPPPIAAPVNLTAEMEKTIPRTQRRSMGRLGLFSALAARSAVEQARIPGELLTGGRCGCVIGSTIGGSASISEAYHLLLGGRRDEMSAMQFFKSVAHTAAFNVANMFGIRGCVLSPSAACASALQAIGLGRDLIAAGTQDVVLCGGADELAPEVPFSFELIEASGGFDRSAPEKASRPFDADRRGLITGEGAGIVVLESLEHARKRKAVILGEIRGYATCASGASLSQSDSSAILRCLELVCRDAELEPSRIGYVNAHATSTIQGDREEAAALRMFFGESVPVSSLKGHLGHTLGASGGIELIASLEMMARSELLPTLNLEHPAEECSGMDLVREIRPHEFDFFLKNSFAFGGINATLLCSRYCE